MSLEKQSGTDPPPNGNELTRTIGAQSAITTPILFLAVKKHMIVSKIIPLLVHLPYIFME